MKKIILIGAGGHATSCVDVIQLTKKYDILGFICDNHKSGDRYLGFKVLGKLKDIAKIKLKTKNLHIAFGSIYNQKKRDEVFLSLKKKGFNFPIIISPIAYVSKFSKISDGTIILHNVTVNANVVIGSNCIINTKANIEHDCKIENNCHISTGANINGNVVIKKNTFIGSGAVVREGKIIKKNFFIKMSEVVK